MSTTACSATTFSPEADAASWKLALKLDIVIVNWNTGPLLRECLGSLAQARLLPGMTIGAVVVVDNASQDGSHLGLPAIAAPVRLIVNADNRGFAAACNQGAAACDGELILFLNPDTRLFADSLRAPVQYLHAPGNEDVGIVGIQLVDDRGHVSRTCARFPRLRQYAAMAIGVDRVFPALGHFMREWDHGDTRTVEQVMGAFFMTRRALFDRLGGFDERFFVYLEEVDFSLRALHAGWRSVYLAQAQAYHLGGGSSGKARAQRLFYALRSRLRFAGKHFTPMARLALWLVILVLEPLPRFLFLLLGGRRDELGETILGYRLLFADLAAAKTRP